MKQTLPLWRMCLLMTAFVLMSIVGSAQALISTCCETTVCEGDSVILTSSPGYEYLWSNGATTPSIVVYESGDFTVTVTDAEGNTSVSPGVSVTVNPLPDGSLSPAGPITFCKGESTELTASGGVSYVWSNGATTSSITVTKAGSYYVEITNEFGCSVTMGPVVVTVNPKPIAVITGGICNFCEGGSVILTANSGASYLWSTGETTQSIVVTTGGDYTVTVTNAFGCSNTSLPTTVTVYDNPEPVISADGPTEFCDGGSVTLTSTAGASYLWSTGETTQSITVDGTGCYTVTVTSEYGCEGSDEICTTEYPNPECSIEGVLEICTGECTTLSAPEGYIYLWNTGATTSSIEVCTGGVYSVTITNEYGCSSTCEVEVIEHEVPMVHVTPDGPTEFCEGGSVLLQASPTGPGYTYEWRYNDGSGWVVVGYGDTYLASLPGMYHVRVTSEYGCESECEPTEIIVYENPVCSIEGVLEFCEGACTTLTASGGVSYEWSTGETTASIEVCAGGVYSVTVTNEYGCTSSCEVEVIMYDTPDPDVTTSSSTPYCEGQTVTLCAQPDGLDYMWSTGETTQCIEVTEGNTYNVTVTNEYGCSANSDEDVTIFHPLPENVEVSIDGDNVICEGECATLTVSAEGDGPFTYEWSTGETTESISVCEGGMYSVVVMSASGCASDFASIEIIESEIPVCTIEGIIELCEGGCTTLTAPAGYTYYWSTGETTQSIEVCEGGVIVLTVTNEYGCYSTCTALVVINPNPECSIEGDLEICTGECTTLSAPEGYSYLWNTGATTSSIEVCTGGVYSVTITNEYGCSSTCEVEVIEHEVPMVHVTPDGPTEFCEGGSVLLQASPTGPGYTYEWRYNDGSGWVVVGYGDTYLATLAGTYHVRVTSEYGCESECEPIEIIIHDNPVCSIEGELEICTGECTTLSAPAGYSYLWSTGETTQSIEACAGGVYSVTITNEYGCSSTCEVEVIEHEVPMVHVTPDGPTEFCEGGSVLLQASPTGPGYTYEWRYNDGSGWVVVGYGDTYLATLAGTYHVRVTSEYGCESECEPIEIIIHDNPVCSIEGELEICTGECTTLSAPAGYSYLWSTGETTQSIEACAGGVYSVTITNEYGCSSTCEVEVIEHEVPMVHVTPDGPTEFCEGGSVLLQASPTGPGYTYEWRYNDGSGWVVVGYGDTYLATLAGTYHVRVTSEYGCESECEPIEIIIHDNPVCSIEGELEICTGECTTLSAPAGYSYLWSTGETTQSIEACAGGVYSVTITNEYGCSSTCEVEVIEHEVPMVHVTPDGPTEFCEGGSVLLQASPTGPGYTYEWRYNDGSGWVVVGYGDTYLATLAGTYHVRVTSEYGCESECEPIIITVYPNPVCSIEGVLEFCEGESTTLTASGGVSYEWSTGETTASIEVMSGGVYSVTVTNEYGCTSSCEVEVIVNPNPDPVIVINCYTTVCQGTVATLTSTPATSYLWSNGETTQSIDVTEAGNYSVTVTNEYGCTGTSNAIVLTIIPAPEASITPEGITEVCYKNPVVYCANAGDGLTYQWYKNGMIIPGSTGMCYTAYMAGDYQVKVTNAAGCSSWSGVGTISLLPNPVVKITAPYGLDLCCLGTVELHAKPMAGYTYQWYLNNVAIPGATSDVYYATEEGAYNYRAWTEDGCSRRSKYKIISCGCGREADITGTEIRNSWIEVFPNPTSELTNVKFALKDAKSGVSLQIISVEGQLVYAESFNDGDDIMFTTLDLGDLAKGIYFITITSGAERLTEKLIVN
ncbi:MAG: T9SS type A sorting domain-containing protein [Bacteroidetes bacterium]|nr:T9SS type A sorting domain-containing protein [Bacteroidota bacterium]